MKHIIEKYLITLNHAFSSSIQDDINELAKALMLAWRNDKNIYLCGNGGSAGNAVHVANDLLYGAGIANGQGLKVEALSANPAVLTCLANDLGYEHIYSEQINVKGSEGDLLIALSGSGKSPNIIKAIEAAAKKGMETFAILGFDGGACKLKASHVIHFHVNDMQIAEDLQLIVLHMCMKFLSQKKLS